MQKRSVCTYHIAECCNVLCAALTSCVGQQKFMQQAAKVKGSKSGILSMMQLIISHLYGMPLL